MCLLMTMSSLLRGHHFGRRSMSTLPSLVRGPTRSCWPLAPTYLFAKQRWTTWSSLIALKSRQLIISL